MQTPRDMADAPPHAPAIDRQQHVPFLLRIFALNSQSVFEPQLWAQMRPAKDKANVATLAGATEVQMYTWLDATFGEISRTVLNNTPVLSGTQEGASLSLDFSIVFPSRVDGAVQKKHAVSVSLDNSSSRQVVEGDAGAAKQLQHVRFLPGDWLLCEVRESSQQQAQPEEPEQRSPGEMRE